MSTITIIQGNSNDKDNTRAYMVKGEAGVSPTVTTTKVGDTATITVTDGDGEHTFTLTDGVSPTVTTSKTGGVTTITITDAEGTHIATINDGEIQISDIVDNLTSTDSQKPLSANQGKILKDLIDTKENSNNFALITGTLEIESMSSNTTTINYPTNFSKNNSVVISTGLVTTGDSNAKGYNYYGIYTDSSDGLNNAFRRRVNLTNDNIKLFVENPNSASLSVDYKIVLMKVS